MKGILPWLVFWAGYAGTGDNFCPALYALISPETVVMNS